MVSNFATQNCCYVAAYWYACKDKPLTDILHNPDRSEMSNIHLLSQKKKIKKFQSSAKKRQSSATNTEMIPVPKPKKIVTKKKRLANSDISDFMSKENIRKDSELM